MDSKIAKEFDSYLSRQIDHSDGDGKFFFESFKVAILSFLKEKQSFLDDLFGKEKSVLAIENWLFIVFKEYKQQVIEDFKNKTDFDE